MMDERGKRAPAPDQAGQAGGGAVDCHAHIYHRGMRLAGAAWHSPHGEALAETFVSELDRAGVGRAVLAAASIYADTNDYMMEALERHPRLRATAIVQPDVTAGELRALADAGFVGIRLQWRYLDRQPDLGSAEYRSLLGRIADLGWHVQLHDNAWRLAPAIRAIEPFGIPLVIDHFGRPDPVLGVACPGFQSVLQAVLRGRTWVKMSGAFRVGPLALVRTLADVLLAKAGPTRLLWGSDWPFAAFEGQFSYADTLGMFEALVPDQCHRDAVHRTAGRFYFGDG